MMQFLTNKCTHHWHLGYNSSTDGLTDTGGAARPKLEATKLYQDTHLAFKKMKI